MAKYNLTIDSIDITQTRSKRDDTNWIGLTLKLGNEDPMPTTVQYLGNMNNGNHPVNVTIGGFDFGQDDILAFNYVIVNAGSTNIDQARAALKAAGTNWVTGGGPSTPPAPPLASANGIDTDYLVAQLVGIFRSTCDGIVAAEQNQLVFGQLPITQVTSQPGTHSPSGCGNNSHYVVKWHIAGGALQMPPLDTKQDVLNLETAGITNIKTKGMGNYVQSQTPLVGVWIDPTTEVTVTYGANRR